jgi:hypothetical protein
MHPPGLSDRIPFHLERRKTGTIALFPLSLSCFPEFQIETPPLRAIRS